MKRFLTMIVAISSILAAMAQNPMVTLSHNGELTFFTNLNAFNAAYEAAENGDILYLSEGNFILDGGKCTISKRLSIVGSGYKSHILGNITINMEFNPDSWMDAPLFDGVRLDILDIYSYSITNLGESEIVRSMIKEIINADCAGTNITYDKCYVKKMSMSLENTNLMIKNSKIDTFEFKATPQNTTVINCNINDMDYYPTVLSSSIVNAANEPLVTLSWNTADIKPQIYNTLFRFTPENENVTKNNCYLNNINLLNDNLEATIDLNNYLGQDGKEAGIYGGESPFSENPSLPTVDTSKSSVEYDAAGNKLKVLISVKAD